VLKLLSIGLLFLSLAGCERTMEPRAPITDWAEHRQFVASVLEPFWDKHTMRETVLFIAEEGAPPRGRLLFRPTRILSVGAAAGEASYGAGQDWKLDPTTGDLLLLPGSHIAHKTMSELHPPLAETDAVIPSLVGDPARGIFWSEGATYQRLQVAVEYEHRSAWQGWRPGEQASEPLRRTIQRIRAGEPLSVMLCGDSIAAGANATGYIGVDVAPHQPPFGELVAAGLEALSGGPVSLENNGKGGWGAADGLRHVREWRLGRHQPDLVIVAYGMNDVGKRSAREFTKAVRGILEAFRRDAPEAEFILVSPMIGNPRWDKTPFEQFGSFREALEELAGDGVAFVDMTGIWAELMRHKSYYDMTGNGVNHPNDFGHRLYAQAILTVLRPDPKGAQ